MSEEIHSVIRGAAELLPAATMNDTIGVHQDVIDSDPTCRLSLTLSYLPFSKDELAEACADLRDLVEGTPFKAEVSCDGVLLLFCEPRAAWPVASHLEMKMVRSFAEFADNVHRLLKMRRENCKILKEFERLRDEY